MIPIAEPIAGPVIGARIRAGVRVLAGIGLAVTLLATAGNSAELAPSVEVDMTALDQLGPPRAVAPGERIVLHRPVMASATAGTPEKPAASTKQPEIRAAARTPVKSATPTQPATAIPSADGKAAGKPAPATAKSTTTKPASTTRVATAEPGPEKTPTGPAAAGKTAPAVGKATKSVAALTSDGTLRITFAEGSAALPEAAREPLAAIARKLKADPGMRLRLAGYAGGDDAAARRARRLALSRALAVRLYLTQQGIGGTRTRVQARRLPLDESQADRVDVAVIGQ